MIDFGESERSFSIAFQLAKNRGYLLYITKTEIFTTTLAKSVGSGEIGEIILSRSRALKYASKGERDLTGTFSIFGQMFRALHGKPACMLRKSDQLWKVLFAGQSLSLSLSLSFAGHSFSPLFFFLFTLYCSFFSLLFYCLISSFF